MTDVWTFNIIYTPGTVSHLLPFVTSLLNHSDARFRLVSNGCLPPERRMLNACANAHDRLEFLAMPGDGCQPHAAALNTLRAIETPGPFCFMDFDIVASGPFTSHLKAALAGAVAVFSGAPVWLPDGDTVFRSRQSLMGGEYLLDRASESLGCTYVAVYDAAVLDEACHTYGIGFDEYAWQDLTPAVQQILTNCGRRADRYDTGKVVSALLKGKCVHVELDGLHHLGGFSFLPLKSRNARRWPNAPVWLVRLWRQSMASWVSPSINAPSKRAPNGLSAS